MNTLLAAAALALALDGPAAAQPAAEFAATTLNLSAAGEVKAAPDLASLSLGVVAEAPTAAAALADDSERMNRTIAALRRMGVADADIHTTGLNLQAQYAFTQGQPQRLTGYQASNQLTITVQDIARVGALLDAAVAAGADQVNGVSFALKDATAAEDAARLQAVAALRAKAELYAKASGYRVGRLVRLSEGGGGGQPIQPRPVMMMARAAAKTPVEAGQLDVRIEVDAVYELVR